jgi:2-hydroxychromene-2-carboxylate isomerase
MVGSLTFYFDFASPYAYVAFDETVKICKAAKINLVLRPVLVWAVLKAQGISPPFQILARETYMLPDMTRSAAFFGLPYAPPDPLAISAHRAARLWLALAGSTDDKGVALAAAIYSARFAQGFDITDERILYDIATQFGYSGTVAVEQAHSEPTRLLLNESVASAVSDNALGAPYFMLDGEGFFGADRLAQIRWRLNLPPFDPCDLSR